MLGEEGRQQEQLRAGEGRNAHPSVVETWAPHSGFPLGWALGGPRQTDGPEERPCGVHSVS